MSSTWVMVSRSGAPAAIGSRRAHPRPLSRGAAALLAVALAACGPGSGAEGAGDDGAGDPYFPKAGNGGYDVAHYDLVLAYDPAGRRLTGTATIDARVTEDLTALNLDLQGLDVDAVTVDGVRARFGREGQELTVRPRRALDRGAHVRVVVRYSGRPGRSPTATAPRRAGCAPRTGRSPWASRSAPWPGSRATTTPPTRPPTPSPSPCPRACGRSPTANRPGRRPRTAAPHTAGTPRAHGELPGDGRDRPHDVHRGETAGGLPLFTAVDPEQAAASRATVKLLPEVVEWAERRFGPYPFSSAGAVVERPGDAGYALETQNRPVFPGAPDTALLVHEIAHQWYGDSVTPRTWRDMWLNEGFATYAQWLWEEDHGGGSAQHTFDRLYAGSYFPDAGTNAALWSFPPADPPDAAHISATPVYWRGAMVLHMVRRTAGDEAFGRLLRGWAATYRHANASTDDFTAYVEKTVPGKDFSRVWEEWLYGEGRPATAS